MTMSRLAACILSMGSALVISGAAMASSLTVGQMEALSGKAAADKAKRDLLSLLRPNGDVWAIDEAGSLRARVTTPPISAGPAGLCARDELYVDYGSHAPGNIEGRETAPAGFSARRTYHVMAAPIAFLPGGAVQERQVWMVKCDTLQSETSAKWFPEADFVEAAKAANALWMAGESIRAGRLMTKDCDLRELSKTCSDIVVEGARDLQIREVGRNCTPGSFQECFVVDAAVGREASFRFTIAATFEADSLIPKEIAYVSVDGPLFYRFKPVGD